MSPAESLLDVVEATLSAVEACQRALPGIDSVNAVASSRTMAGIQRRATRGQLTALLGVAQSQLLEQQAELRAKEKVQP